jgi:ATP-dependent helicase HrpA
MNLHKSISYPPQLPISRHKDFIIEAMENNQVIIIAGDTGSGKSTQLPKMCLEAGRGKRKMIGCTQPRRIAATSVAARVAEELVEFDREIVGYKIRFADHTGRRTRIKFMTDGILLAETLINRNLSSYDTLIIDEAHERSLNIDFLLGYLKELLKVRKDLKVIITSATIDTEKFSAHFSQAPVIEIAGRTYPVSVSYRPLAGGTDEADEEENYISMAVQAAVDIYRKETTGDMLIFMPTEKDIRESVEQLNNAFASQKHGRPPLVLPLFGRLRTADQRRVFKQVGGAKIIVATNVAETSITVPGIRYVIDTGLARISTYNARARTTSLPVAKISRASCDQRMGRCGRVGPGICIRLYAEEDYLRRPPYTLPEIKRANLAEVILRMMALHLGDIAAFPFVDPPHPRSIRDGYKLLAELQAIVGTDGRWQLTDQGRMMARLPLDPCLSRIMIEAREHNALREILIIVSALTLADPRNRPADKVAEADKAHARFAVAGSDFLSFLALWDLYHSTLLKVKSQSGLRKFCQSYFLSSQRMREWLDIHDQIHNLLKESGGFLINRTKADYDAIHKSILSGFLRNIGTKKSKNIYLGCDNKELMIFPGSNQFHKAGSWIVAAELVETNKLYARCVADIKSEWLEPIAGFLCRSSYSAPRWEKKKGQVVADEKVTLFGLVIVAGRKIHYGGLPGAAREEAREIFIRRALLDGELNGRYAFLEHNQLLIKKLMDMEDRFRQRNVVADDFTLFKFYDQRLDNSVFDQASLNRFLRKKSGEDLLKMTEDDVLVQAPAIHLEEDFPQQIRLGDFTFPLTYSFNPGKDDDGVTVTIPSHLASQVNPSVFEWLVPGLLREKVSSLLKSLPKNIRRHFIPLPTAVDALLKDLVPYQGNLYLSLNRAIQARYGVLIERSQWPVHLLPEHLQMRFQITDAREKPLRDGRSFADLLASFASKPDDFLDISHIKKQWEKDDISEADLVGLPQKIQMHPDNILQGHVYPGLVLLDSDGHGQSRLGIRLFTERQESRRQTRRGMLALYSRNFVRQTASIRQACETFCKRKAKDLKELPRALEGEIVTATTLFEFLLDEIFATRSGLIHSREQFEGNMEKIRKDGFMPAANDMLATLQRVMHERQHVVSQIKKYEGTRRTSAAAAHQEKIFRQELAALLPADFLNRFDYTMLKKKERYLKALAIRIDRAHTDPGKDDRKAAQLLPFIERTLEWQLPVDPSPECIQLYESYQEMIEEFKISLFAQEIKTLYPVSMHRLEAKWREVKLSC